MSELFKLIAGLASVHGVSGREGPVSEAIRALVSPYADEVCSDAMGNLIVRRRGGGRRILFSAHMDSIGLIATHIDENGFIRFAAVGGVGPQSALYSRVRFANGTRGVVAQDGKADPKDLKLENLYIDIGARGREQARRHVAPGDTAAYDAESFLCGSTVVSPYLDDRIGCAALIMALGELKETRNDLYFVFSAQEEVGLRGAKTAAYAVDPDYGLAIDVTPAGDTPEASPKMDCALGAGAAIKIMDSSVLCHPRVVSLLEKAAEDNGIPWQREILVKGGTDAGAIHTARAGVYTGAVSIPTRCIHSASEMADIGDVEACARLIAAFSQLEL